jgi:hypothetical protein
MDRDLFESEALDRAGLSWDDLYHCGSCHSDSEDGYYMSGVIFKEDGRYAEVCCEAANRLVSMGLTK